jgi:heme-degrading monooxygenase HmoA
MSIVRINALNVPPQAGDEIAKRFSARADSLADVAGFEGFELLRPTSEAETRWFVYTRWSDEEAYAAWRDGDGARNAHAGPPPSSEPGADAGSADSGSSDSDESPNPPPVSMGATLLEFDVAVEAPPSGA